MIIIDKRREDNVSSQITANIFSGEPFQPHLKRPREGERGREGEKMTREGEGVREREYVRERESKRE